MSICPYNKNTKSIPSNTPTNSTTKTSRDERPGSSFPSKGPARRQQQIGFESKRGFNSNSCSRNWKHQRLGQSKKDQRFEKYAPGGSYVSPEGKVKDGSRKVSLNHLLNFRFEPRDFDDVTHSHCYLPKRNGYRRISSGSVFNKERFLQANSQFLVKQDKDYSIHAVDPDAPVPWEYVEKVLLHVDNDVSCPICLYPPTVPKITKCGHVYCWPCILHYLALDERGKSVRDCPICMIEVRKMDLRSVSFLEASPLQVAGVVKMNLMFRETTSLTPSAVLQREDVDMSELNGSILKITPYSPARVLDFIVEPELQMLKAKLSVEDDEFERDFLNCAVVDCEIRQAELLTQISSSQKEGIEAEINDTTGSVRQNLGEESASAAQDPISPVSFKEAASDTNMHYFYQMEDGSNVFLDGVNVKCLLREFSHFKNCPPVIEAPLLHVDSFIMTEDLRKRHKYLSHLPLSCEYKIAELDLKPPLLSQETLDEFEGVIKRRMKSRQRKEKLENDLKKRAEVAEQRKYEGFLRENRFTVTESEFVINSANIDIKSSPKRINLPIGSLTSDSSEMSLSPPQQNLGSMSFAEKLRTGEASTIGRQWPNQISATQNDDPVPSIRIDGDNDDDPYYHAPAFQSSFGDALSAALDGLQSTSIEVAETPVLDSGGNLKGKRKKGKKKQKLLFSTSNHMRP